MLTEQQFKLGATFALVGEYELAYFWLKRLYKYGFDGDGPFYYWLANSAYYTGRESFAKTIWKTVLEINPEKEGTEPWNEEQSLANGFEDHSGSIYQKLESDYIEERLFAIFLVSVSGKMGEVFASKRFNQNQKLSAMEKEYVSLVKFGKPAAIQDAQEIAEVLYQNHHPIGPVESGLFLMWFSVFVELSKSAVRLNNKQAWAGAMEYVWYKASHEKVSQQEIANRYGISTATIGKYVKFVNNHLS